jgi:hypothetical protein
MFTCCICGDLDREPYKHVTPEGEMCDICYETYLEDGGVAEDEAKRKGDKNGPN